MINVVLVDDHELVRTGMKRLLGDAPDIKVIGEAGDGEEAIKLIERTKPDVVLMDLNMPGINGSGLNGLDVTRKLIRSNPKLKIIVVTVCKEGPFPERLVRAGASGYVTKNTNMDELIAAIRKVVKGQIYITPEIAQSMALRQVSDASKSPFSKLSERELQVMYMVTQGIKVNDVANKLFLSPKTVNTYRYRLFEKLGVHNDVELTHLAIRYSMVDGDGNLNEGEEDKPPTSNE
ncbi:MAG: UvrY/SirA/GacA family response regulator transcription factor [Rickettsiella sp.]|nr:UvrY/SirA/GacA family response regulator transcription factor [Rickettsiella sp.]